MQEDHFRLIQRSMRQLRWMLAAVLAMLLVTLVLVGQHGFPS